MRLSWEKSIIATLNFFDLFDQPLTQEELFRFLYNPPAGVQAEFLSVLDSGMGKWCETFCGYYFLPGRKEIVEARRRRTVDNDKKLKIARRGARLVGWVPFVRAVFLCNTTAWQTANPDSDIDFFIVIRHGRIWLARALVTLTLSLFGLRRHGRKVENRICLSFYITDENLNLRPVSTSAPDIYLVYWLSQLLFLGGENAILASLYGANRWVQELLPNAFNFLASDEATYKSRTKRFLEKMWGAGYGDLLESQARSAQLTRMKMFKGPKGAVGDGCRVVISDKMLKFHEQDRREEIREKWLKRVV